ncbi:MAG: choline dehydrogenase-like flavoprotein [Rhodothermales bacterium]
MASRQFSLQDQVDFVVIGSGAAGGVMAKELSEGGFSVVVLEQGPYLTSDGFRHDEIGGRAARGLGTLSNHTPQSFRTSVDEEPEPRGVLSYLPMVGGTSVHYTGNFWRFREIDFIERSLFGPVAGTGIEDWPITYADLEPYYTKVEWEVGVSGGPNHFDPPRSRPYPMKPMPIKSSGVLFKEACEKLGLHPGPAPMAILSEPYDGRSPCIHCGFCMGNGCEVDAKSSSLVSMIPKAEATGNCEIRPLCTASRIDTNTEGRVTRVVYFNPEGEEVAQPCRAAVVCANGCETPRLLLMSDSPQFPNGLANSSGVVGKYILDNGQVHVYGQFEEPMNEFKSIQVTQICWDYYDTDPKRGFWGGGGMDARFQFGPVSFARNGLHPDQPKWGSEYKRLLSHYYNRTIDVNGHTTIVPVETNNLVLDRDNLDRYGRPGLIVTLKDHPDDQAVQEFFVERCKEVVQAMNPTRMWSRPVGTRGGQVHLLGTCRMGDDPTTSVIDKYHRTHDVPNLFLCDGSSFVSSGRGQPTMTIQALAFRAADHIAEFARRGEI